MSTEGLVAVLIDFENVGLAAVQELFNKIPDIGRIIVKRAYADWSIAKYQEKLIELGIELVHITRSGGSGKNSCDIRLTMDTIDLLHNSPVDTFVIASSDSDFVPLVSKLRSHGKIVYGAGRKAITPNQLVRSCDRYLFLDVQKEAKKEADKKPSNKEDGSLLIKAVQASMDEEGKVSGSKLLQTIQRIDPGFDFRQLGYTAFSKYLEASPYIVIDKPQQGDITIKLKDNSFTQTTKQTTSSEAWDSKIDKAWSKRAAKTNASIPGPTAAKDISKILGIDKLSTSEYKTLQGVLNASTYLQAKWKREGNKIVRL